MTLDHHMGLYILKGRANQWAWTGLFSFFQVVELGGLEFQTGWKGSLFEVWSNTLIL